MRFLLFSSTPEVHRIQAGVFSVPVSPQLHSPTLTLACFNGAVPPSTIPLTSDWKQHSTQPSSGHVTLPSEEDSEGILTSDCAKVHHVFGEVKDGLSETRRGLAPEE
ncbi:uncharacterized protein N7518_000624 [Penicillium psychrosexuale]|uniref:uncharacterized protein n=1 Tax=Penicillium psychrosexuale TaxID=1002107 RepID=UPI0025458DFD|nr:uncharacterized protein N7518_000624 [Penicillium psychrosexuale]KAJ5804321.1 hypothetical protein N7518_000624 [Penicillium psychrosexuale]